ncbi:hypothetical protein DOTSEDRAFT_24621 [Dothistroma septosporum NZE10]|uniref:Uncharacterized protein n=1 Tax=Dothistroma septosporum (strain NZE10 / CBS 128990) TaxID=675120 RepID=N1PQC3_DOTSN|nr:hypothetical protein DOTSEDRAFT_24621 [Dothistroma septosporum NZE10]
MSPTKRTTRRRAPAVTAAKPAATTIKSTHHEAKKQAKTVNVNAMFDPMKPRPKQRKEHDRRDVLKPAGIKKSPSRGIFKPFRRNKDEDLVSQLFDPDYFINCRKPRQVSPELPIEGFANLTTRYLEAQNDHLQDVHERHARSLAARRYGLPSSEDPEADGERPWIPRDEDIEAIDAQIVKLEMPLEDDIIQVQWREPNGAGTVRPQRLGDLIEKLTQRIAQRTVQIKELETERRKVAKEIEVLKADVQGESADTMKVSEKFEVQMQALQDEIGQLEKSTKAELEKLKREERAATKKLNDTLKEVMDTLL